MSRGLLLIAAFFIYVQAFSQSYVRATVSLDNRKVGEIAALGVAVDHYHRIGNSITGDFSTEEVGLMENAGFKIDVLEADAEAAYVRQAKVPFKDYARDNEACIMELTKFDHQKPVNFNGGSYLGNYRYEEMLAELDKMASLYPNLISVRQPIGDFKTHEDRPIYWVRISDNASVDEDEPEILYTALHHAREPVSLTQMIYYMWYLLENATSNDKVASIIRNTELYFIPCVNPDGYIYNETTKPQGGGLWRKNRRNNGDGTFGVDLNRNYGHEWGHDNQGSTGSTGSLTYRGPAPFSEPETQAVRAFVLDHDFEMALNYHTHGGFLIYPYGYTEAPPDDIHIFEELASLLTQENNYHFGNSIETVEYLTNGDSDDWMYSDQEKDKIFPLTPEVGTDGFWPHPDEVIIQSKACLKQNLDAAFFLLNSGVIIDQTEPYFNHTVGSWPFILQKMGFEEVGLTLNFKPITDNISFNAPFKLYILGTFSQEEDKIDFQLASDIQDGERIKFAYTIDNGTYVYRDTIVKYYREQNFVFENDGSAQDFNTSNILNNWGESTVEYFSVPSSLTDSPQGNTVPYTTNYLTTQSPVFLEFADSSLLTFRAKWDIQNHQDYVVLEISTNGTSYMPLCGRYSEAGRLQLNAGLPVYTGRQKDWVLEQIDLSPYIGEDVYLRFSMVSTNTGTRDGIYLDDINILQYDQGDITSTHEIPAEAIQHTAYPNPSSEQLTIQMESADPTVQIERLVIFDQLGRQILNRSFSKSITIPVDSWSPGLYYYQYIDKNGAKSAARKLMIH